MSNGKPIKEILPEVIRKLIIQRKHYLKQQRINRRKKNRDPNQPKLPGMKQGGVMAKGKGPHGKTKKQWLKETYPGQFRNENNEAFAPKFHTKGRARGGFVKKAGGTKRVPGSGAATKGTNFEGIF